MTIKLYNVMCGNCGKEYKEIDYDKPLPCCPNYWMMLYHQLRK